MSRRRWASLIVASALLALPACAGGRGLPWAERTPGNEANIVVTKGTPLPTKPVPQPQRDFAIERTVPGAGGYVPTGKSKQMPLVIEDDPPVLVEMTDPSTTPKVIIERDPMLVKEPPLLGAVRAYIAGKPEEAVEILKALDPPNQELMLQLIPALVRASQTNISTIGPQDASVQAAQLAAASAAFARRASLSIEKTAFCWTVKHFGRYNPVPAGTRFKPGEIYILYVELGNVPCVPAVQNGVEGYLTRLNCTLQLRDANDKVLELTSGQNEKSTTELSETKADFSRSPLKDYFMQFWFTAPSKPGKYVVNFKIRDPNTGREISKSEPFYVGGQ